MKSGYWFWWKPRDPKCANPQNFDKSAPAIPVNICPTVTGTLDSFKGFIEIRSSHQIANICIKYPKKFPTYKYEFQIWWLKENASKYKTKGLKDTMKKKSQACAESP